MRYFIFIALCFLCVSCASSPSVVHVYHLPEIPGTLLYCEEMINTDINTNGGLLTSYIDLKTKYKVCSAKVKTISNILDAYRSTLTDQPAKEDKNDNIKSN